MAVAISGVQVELREVMLRDKPPEMLAASPKGTVPVLVLLNGKVLEESLDIMRWALTESDPESWLGYEDHDLITANDGPFKQALDRYKYPHRYGLGDGTEHRDATFPHLSRLNDVLADGPYLGGPKPAFTDIALFPFIRQFAATDAAWFAALPLPALNLWLLSIIDSELFAKIMTRYPQWQPGDSAVIFP